jgi:Zn finger protein HypA/HybF involved in hydrogenase expression
MEEKNCNCHNCGKPIDEDEYEGNMGICFECTSDMTEE